MDGSSGEVADMSYSRFVPKKLLYFQLQNVKFSLKHAIRLCNERGLNHSIKWLAELLYTVSQHMETQSASTTPSQTRMEDDEDDDFEEYTLSKSYFDLKEYDRAAHFSESCTSARGKFLHYYSRYLSSEKKRTMDIVDPFAPTDRTSLDMLNQIRSDLSTAYREKSLDSFGIYLYGVVLKKLDLLSQAKDMLVKSIHLQPLFWGAWLELAGLINDRETLFDLHLPDHWMRCFFAGHCFIELQMNQEALELYDQLSLKGFKESTYVMSQIAVTLHNTKNLDPSINMFKAVRDKDPFRLDQLDIYSHLLYVKEMKLDLSYLAHNVASIDKYRVETCVIIGNYYSLRQQHEKAAIYYQRALRLNPQYLSAWTLMGHEYMELRNTNAALHSYRQAIEVNRRDFRGWYGLGQAYDLLKMHHYSLYYYTQAHLYAPNDSRMVVALAETYEKLDRLDEAKKYFNRAIRLGDIECAALLKLAKLHERLDEHNDAAITYIEYIHQRESQGIHDTEDQSRAHRFLANYYLKEGNLQLAYDHAARCTDYNDTREEGKAILREIAQRRGGGSADETADMSVEMSIASQASPDAETVEVYEIMPQ